VPVAAAPLAFGEEPEAAAPPDLPVPVAAEPLAVVDALMPPDSCHDR